MKSGVEMELPEGAVTVWVVWQLPAGIGFTGMDAEMTVWTFAEVITYRRFLDQYKTPKDYVLRAIEVPVLTS